MKTSEIKPKVSAKVAAAKAKIAAKCGKASKCAKAVATLVALAVLSGCATADAPTAQRAQTVTAKDISIVINLAPAQTNAVVSAPSIHMEIATAAQANDTSGTESMTTTPTQTPTLDVSPKTTVNYGLTSSTASGTDWISQLTSASAKGLSSWLSSKSDGEVTVTKADGTSETVSCSGGVCSLSSGDTITYGGSSSSAESASVERFEDDE